MLQKIIKFIGLGIFIFGITAICVYRGFFMGIQHSLQNKFYDYDMPGKNIVIVAIDEKSMRPDELGPFKKWPRDYYAKAIEALKENGAAVIAFDVTFPDAGEGDDKLAEALQKYKNIVLAGRYYFENGQRKAELPNPLLMFAKPTVGWINIKQDEDGFVRQLPIVGKENDEILEAFPLAVARGYQNLEPLSYEIIGNEYPFAPGIRIPVITQSDDSETIPLMYINYSAGPNQYQQISFTDVLNKKWINKLGNPADVKDKIVLIGPTAIDLGDHYMAPASEGVKMAGVEIHANAIQTVLERSFLRNQSRSSFWLIILGLITINGLLFASLRIRWALALVILEMAGVLVAGIVSYEFGIFLNVVYPILSVVLSFIGTFLLRFLFEQKKRKFIQNAFGHYVNKSVVEEILRHPESLELGGIKRQITSFFSDIANFTSLSEKMEPQELVKFLNEYLQEMTEIILARNGTLDKYEGDAIVAFWSAPLEQYGHTKSACLAALENQTKLRELRKKWQRQGKPELHVRIGINSGEAIVGNIGSTDRFDYTAIGDNVNLASRLEGINKEYGTEIIISESAYENVKDDFVCRELDMIRVKGKEKPVKIYELLAEIRSTKSEILNKLKILNSKFETALNSYRQKQFKEALEQFAAIKDDPPARVFAERCDEFLKNPPPRNWDGVWIFNIK